MINIREYEERIGELEIALEEIAAFGSAYIRGEKKEAADVQALQGLLDTYRTQLDAAIRQPVTLDRCRRMIYLCHEAMETVLAGKEYEMEGMKLTRASLPDIKALLNYWETEKTRLETGERKGVMVYRGVNFDD